MPSRRQHNRSHWNHVPTYLMEDEIDGQSGSPNDGLDPKLFALATILPMSCFPINDVHPSERYGFVANKPRPLRKNATHDISYNSMISTTPNLQIQCPSIHGIDHEDHFGSLPPLSASTASSGRTSCWSSTESATSFRNGGTHDMVPSHCSWDARFTLPDSFLDSASVSYHLAEDFNIAGQRGVDDAWNALTSCGPGSGMLGSHFHPGESQVPGEPSSSRLFIDGFTEYSFNMPNGFQNSSFAAAAVTSPCELLPEQPAIAPWTGLLSPVHSPDDPVQEADDFLNELGNLINWDNAAEPSSEHPPADVPGFLETQYANEANEDSLPGEASQESHELDLKGNANLQDDWEQEYGEGDAENSADLSA